MTPSEQYMPGLTGLRGIAVGAVVAYHLGVLRGGFLGVDVFFALSGFLITGLLLRNPPSIPRGLARWWMKRYRRLTPAVAVVVLAVLVAFATRTGVVMNAIATLTWWQNWHLIVEGKPYWAASPSALRHAWSLSIEEQFYAFWPVIMLSTLAAARRLRMRRPGLAVAAVAIAGATASFALSFVMALTEGMSLTRIYYGTDTRIGGLLLGCAIAALASELDISKARPIATVAALPAGLGLIALTVLITPEDRFTYTGGLLLATILSLVLVVASTGTGVFTSGLSWSPLQWLGDHSYALYLWSWPAQVFAEDRFPDAPRPAVIAFTVAVSLVLSTLSLRMIEDPLRRGTTWAARLWARRAAWVSGYSALVIALAIAGSSTQLSTTEKVAKEFEKLPDPTTTTTTACIPPTTVTTLPPDFTGGEEQFDDSTVTEGTDPTRNPCASTSINVLVVGDSTARGAANGLRRLEDPSLQVWDRSELGCGLQAPAENCPDWKMTWPVAVAEIDPDVVLAYARVSEDLVPGDDPPFMSEEASVVRRGEMSKATEVLSTQGAHVIWVLPPRVGTNGEFYCDMRRTDSPCDPVWIDRWRADLSLVAALHGATTIDVQSWIDSRPPEGASKDRPDGLHFSGAALDAHAGWLADQIRTVDAQP